MGRAFEVRKASMAKTGAAKAKLYTKFSREIYMLAKNGTPDPEANLALKHMMEKAKKQQVPADIIARAVEKAKGGGGEDYQAVRYEGFGPNGSTIIVDCLTDNVNRTVSEVKVCFTKSKSKMGVSGSVAHMYDNLGIIEVANLTEEEVMEALIEGDVDPKDIEVEGNIIIYVEAVDLHKAVVALSEYKAEIEILEQEIAMLPQIETELDNEEDKENFQKLLNMLDEVDDVQEVYHSVVNI